jgi:hypothetical protein
VRLPLANYWSILLKRDAPSEKRPRQQGREAGPPTAAGQTLEEVIRRNQHRYGPRERPFHARLKVPVDCLLFPHERPEVVWLNHGAHLSSPQCAPPYPRSHDPRASGVFRSQCSFTKYAGKKRPPQPGRCDGQGYGGLEGAESKALQAKFCMQLSGRTPRYSPVHMIRLTKQREIDHGIILHE